MTRLRMECLEGRDVPAVVLWDGGGIDSNWMTAANWVGDVAPQPGDDIVFPVGPTLKTAFNNFAAGTNFNSLAVNEAGYSIGGNGLNVTAGVTAVVNATGTSTSAQINLAIGGTGGLTVNGDTLRLLGANTYTGVTAVNAGSTLVIVTNTSLGAAGAGNETNVAVGGSLFVGANNLNVAESINFAGGGTGDRAGIAITTNVNATFSGPLTLTANGLLRIESGSVVTITSGLGETGGPRNLRVDNFGGRLVFAPGTTNAVTGTTTLRGTVVANGTGPNGTLLSDAGTTLAGTGTVGGVQLNSLVDVLAPGAFTASNSGTVGTLTTARLTIPGAIYVADITNAGSDRVVANGAVVLGRTLQPVFGSGFAPTPGQRFLLIDNDGTDPILGTFIGLAEGTVVATFGTTSLRATYVGGNGNDFELVAGSTAATQRFAVGAGTGGGPQVNVYDGNGNLVRAFNAYDPSFRGGVNVATGDVNGDGVPDVVTGPGFGGGPVVRVWDGQTGALLREFLAYDSSFRGGVNVATGFLDADNLADIITGAGRTGGPHVKGFGSASQFNLTVSFFAYDTSFTGGVSVSGGERTRQVQQSTIPGTIVTGAGPTGGSHVRVFNAVTGAANGPGFFAFPGFFGGINVAFDATAGNIIVAPKEGGGPIVRGFNAAGALQFEFLAYDAAFRGGVSVGVRPLGPSDENQVITGPASNGGPFVRVWSANGSALVRQFNAFDPAFQGGIYVG